MNVSISVLPSSDPESRNVFVRICIDGKNFDFSRTCGSAEDAFAVKGFLDRALSEQIRQVREVEYLRGYRQGRSKQGKRLAGGCTLWIGDWMRKEAGL